jgi:hypothetical protein
MFAPAWAEKDGASPWAKAPRSLSLWLEEKTVPVHASSDEQSSESIRNNSFSAQAVIILQGPCFKERFRAPLVLGTTKPR